MTELNFQYFKSSVEESGKLTGHFLLQSLEAGQGLTIGNALRRVLLSNLEGTAITGIKIPGIAHEFSTLTVRENLMMVPPHQSGEHLVDAWFRPQKIRDEEALIGARADEVIEFLQIEVVANELAGNLSGGQKKLLELGRTMMVDAKIVFLDEVGAGVNRTLLNVIGDAVLRLNKECGYTFCMIEHDMEFISRLCDPVIVMAEGQVLATGSAESVKNNDAVIEAYLGTGLKNRAGVAL